MDRQELVIAKPVTFYSWVCPLCGAKLISEDPEDFYCYMCFSNFVNWRVKDELKSV